MGAWGTGIWDNDYAQDLLLDIEEMDNQSTMEKYVYANALFSEEFYALYDYYSSNYMFSAQFLDKTMSYIDQELKNIHNWKPECIEERKIILYELKADILASLEKGDFYDMYDVRT